MNRRAYVRAMRRYGFSPVEAERMADFALIDFDSFDEAFEYYSRNDRFLRGTIYAGARKARALFRKRRRFL